MMDAQRDITFFWEFFEELSSPQENRKKTFLYVKNWCEDGCLSVAEKEREQENWCNNMYCRMRVCMFVRA